jgi:hypothetical protein
MSIEQDGQCIPDVLKVVVFMMRILSFKGVDWLG